MTANQSLPFYFDAHTHLNIQFENDWREVGERALKAGVWFVNVGADEKSSKLALEQASFFQTGVWASVGIHPTESEEGDFATIRGMARNEKVVAIGECGLEYFRLKEEQDKERQKKLFKQHLELALELDKPLMVHCRASSSHAFGLENDAYEDIWSILDFYQKQSGGKLRFNMHFFAGDWTVAQKFLGLGGCLSFPGVITFSDQYDEIIKKMPLERLMSETDAPFASPLPHRGRRNEPDFVRLVAEKIANLRQEPKEGVLLALVSNARQFFGV